MTDSPRARVLVVEDLMLIALDIVEHLEGWGYVVVGPFPSVARALPSAVDAQIEIALLDVNLGTHHCFPLAAVLRARAIPFAFLTGHDGSFLPDEFRDVPRLGKPLAFDDLRRTVIDLAAQAPRIAATPAR